MNLQKIVIYGDSISTTEFSGGYEVGLKARLCLESICNHSVSATSLSTVCEENDVETSGIKLVRQNLPAPDTDIVLVWYGTNDWYWGAAPGDLREDSDITFLGAMAETVRLIRASAPNAKIVWLTPIFRVGLDGANKDAYDCPNAAGFTLLNFHEAVIAGCRYHGLHCLDMHMQGNIHAYNRNDLLADGVHPNHAGYQIVLDVLCKYLSTII